jgi:hypothetical protein
MQLSEQDAKTLTIHFAGRVAGEKSSARGRITTQVSSSMKKQKVRSFFGIQAPFDRNPSRNIAEDLRRRADQPFEGSEQLRAVLAACAVRQAVEHRAVVLKRWRLRLAAIVFAVLLTLTVTTWLGWELAKAAIHVGDTHSKNLDDAEK